MNLYVFPYIFLSFPSPMGYKENLKISISQNIIFMIFSDILYIRASAVGGS